MSREYGYTYEVTIKAVVEITCPPSTPKPYLRAALLANFRDLLLAAAPDVITEVDAEAKDLGKGFVESWELLERRDLMSGQVIGESKP